MVEDPLKVTALSYAAACGFVVPCVLAVCRDFIVPGTAAFWVGDHSNHDARLGVLIHNEVGVIEEFNARGHKPGVLPVGGLKRLLVEGDHG